MNDYEECRHGPKRQEPLTRADGTQIGSMTLWVCDQCDAEADADLDEFIGMVVRGQFPPAVSGD